MLSNEYLLANIGVDTAQNEPLKIADSAAWENTESIVSRLLKANRVIAILSQRSCFHDYASLDFPHARPSSKRVSSSFLERYEIQQKK